MPTIAVGAQTLKAELEVAQAETPELEKVRWWVDPGLRKLYFWAAVLCVASATSGYDGYHHLYQELKSALLEDCS